MRAPRFSTALSWSMRRSRRLVRLVLTRIVFSDPTLVTAELVEQVYEQLQAPGAERSFVAWLRSEIRPAGLSTSYEDQLQDLAVPTLLLHGRDDRVLSWRKALRAAGQVGGSKLVIVPRCGHWVMREAPDVFLRELLGWTGGGSAD